MATKGWGRKPLVADRRYASRPASASASTGGPRKPAPPKKAAPRRTARRQHGLIVGTFLFFWRMIWAVLWRVSAVAALVLAGIVFYFYSQLPPVSEIVDARSRGSVTMLDREGKVFAWRGETFGMITSDTVSQDLHDAVVATEDKRFYWHFGISPRGIASAVRINLPRGAGHWKATAVSTITQQVAKLLCLGVEYDPAKWKNRGGV